MIAGLEPVASQTEKACIASYYRQFFININIKIKAELVLNFSFYYPRKAVYDSIGYKTIKSIPEVLCELFPGVRPPP